MIGGYLAAYLKIKAEDLATKEDFQETLRQVRQNTEAVEEVKAAWNRNSTDERVASGGKGVRDGCRRNASLHLLAHLGF
jgi:hypothetical protein